MQRAETNDAISRAVSDINAIPSSDLKSRASVSQGVVLRLLNAAGWDVFDLSQVMPGYRSANTEIGYALLMPRSGSGESPSPRVLVEVRSPGESLEAARTVNRLLGCCASVGAPLGVLTDGLRWRLFLHTAGENRRDGSFCEIDLAGNPEAAAEDVDRYLARERVASGQAVRSAERLLRDRNRDETSRQAIMEGWRQVVGGMDDGLLSLVATAAEQRTGTPARQQSGAPGAQRQPCRAAGVRDEQGGVRGPSFPHEAVCLYSGDGDEERLVLGRPAGGGMPDDAGFPPWGVR